MKKVTVCTVLGTSECKPNQCHKTSEEFGNGPRIAFLLTRIWINVYVPFAARVLKVSRGQIVRLLPVLLPRLKNLAWNQ